MPDQQPVGDGDLARLARAGDEVAFRLLVERHRPMVRARASRLCRDRQELDDLVQESFLQAFVALGRLRDPDLFAAWLGGIVLNVCRGIRRRAPVELVAEWPEPLHPVSADGLPSADDLDRADALRAAVADLPAGQRRAVTLFYYADLPVGEISESAGAAKASLHKARRRLRDYITAHRPDLVPAYAAAGEEHMTPVRIAHAEPRPGRLSTSHVLVVLADDAAHRALPIWLNASDGRSLWRLHEQRGAGPGGPDDADELPPEERTPPEEATMALLRAARASVTGVDVDELGPEVTAARIEIAGTGGKQQVTSRLSDGLALAAAAGAPVRVADALMERLGVAVAGDDLLGPFLERESAAVGLAGASPAARKRRRYEPRNLSFGDGLNCWSLGGTFLREASGAHWRDYSCAAGDGSAVLSSAVADPYGRAILGQEIFADDYRGRAVTFRAQLSTEDVSGHAGLFLRVVSETMPHQQIPITADPRSYPGIRFTAVAGTEGWTTYEVTAEVPGDAMILGFGVFLAGRGRVEVRRAELS